MCVLVFSPQGCRKSPLVHADFLGLCLSEVIGAPSSLYGYQELAGSVMAQYFLVRSLHFDGEWEGSKGPNHLTLLPYGHSTAVIGVP